jgi:hypothetical protein
MAVKDFEVDKEDTDRKIEKAAPVQAEQLPARDGEAVPAEETEVKNAHASGDGSIGRNDQQQLGAETAPY